MNSLKNGVLIKIIFGICIIQSLKSQTNIASGNVYGTWKKSGSPYKINGHVNVPKDSLLKIEAGVKVEFQGAYMMHVYGSVQAIGVAGDSVVFTPVNKTTGWQGIHAHGRANGKDSMLFQYCKFEYANYILVSPSTHGALRLDTVPNARVSNSLFYSNTSNIGGALSLVSSKLKLYQVSFIQNKGMDNSSSATRAAGSAIYAADTRVDGSNLTFVGNKCYLPNNKLLDSTKAYSEGTMYLVFGTYNLNNLVFRKNWATGASCIMTYGSLDVNLNITNTEFSDNYSTSKSCFLLDHQSGTVSLSNLFFKNNKIGYYFTTGQALPTNIRTAAYTGTVKINNITIENSNGYSAAYFRKSDINNLYIRNTDSIAIYVTKDLMNIKNSIIANNRSGIYLESGGSANVVNSIVAYNGAKQSSSYIPVGGLFQSSSSTASKYEVFNSIVQKNINPTGMANLLGSRGGTVIPYLANSIIEGGKDSAKYMFGSGTISVTNYYSVINDTVTFVKPPKGIGPGYWDSTVDFHPLQTCSKAFAGLHGGVNLIFDGTTSIDLNNTLDFAGNPRIKCGTVDIGPYELDGAKGSVAVIIEPTDQVICPRTSAQIQAASCGAELSYQWQKSTDGKSNTFSNIPNANSINYTYPASKDSVFYRLIISQNECNKKDTSRVVKISFKPGSTIVITQQPKDTQICAGTNFNLLAGVAGTNNTYQWQKSSNGTLFTNLNGATTNPFTQKITDSSWYRLLITNTVCASSKDTTKAAKVIKLPLPKPNLGADQKIPNSGSAVLNPGTFSAYQWYKGATTPTYTVNNTNLDIGKNTVWVEVTDAKGCKGRDTIIVDLRPVNGLKTLTEAGIKLYPIPASDLVNISVPNSSASNNYNYELRDLQGKVIIPSTLVNDHNTAVSLKNVPAGVYVFTIEMQGNYYSAKLMKR